MYTLQINTSQDNEVIRVSRSINATFDPHKLVTNIALLLNEGIDSIVSQIVSIIGETAEWNDYIDPVESWLIEHKEA